MLFKEIKLNKKLLLSLLNIESDYYNNDNK